MNSPGDAHGCWIDGTEPITRSPVIVRRVGPRCDLGDSAVDHWAARGHQDEQARGPKPRSEPGGQIRRRGKATLDKKAGSFSQQGCDVDDVLSRSIKEEHLVGVGVEAV